jgi:hypothetical protein
MNWMMTVELHLCGNFLVAAVPQEPDYEDEEDEETQKGIYILDRSSLELMNHFPGNYVCINIAANGDVVAEKAEDGLFDVFRLDDEHLVFHTSFQRRPSQNDRIDRRNINLSISILLVHNSRAYVSSWREGPVSCTEVYNILTGDLERTLWHPNRSSAFCLVAGKKDLFFGFNCDSSIYKALSAIKVNLLD